MQQYLTYDDVNISPKFSEILSRSQCDITGRITQNEFIKLPIIAAPMDTVCELEMSAALALNGGIGCVHRFMGIERQVNIIDDFYKIYCHSLKTTTLVAAIGVKGDYFERFQELFKIGCRIFCLDAAHGHHILVKNAIEKLKSENPKAEIIAGNIATAKAAFDLIDWGADSLRVGIGGGSLCETRIRTGVGVPMISCLQEICEVSQQYDIPVIADGGIRTIGDIAKALGAGASSVMVGSLISGTKETPGEVISSGQWPNELKYKQYRGSASNESKNARGEKGHVEGNSFRVPYKGKVKRILDDISDGIKSSFSYTGSMNLEEFQRNVEFVQVTSAGVIEAKPHLMFQ